MLMGNIWQVNFVLERFFKCCQFEFLDMLQAMTAGGQRLLEIDVTQENLSEVLSCYLKAMKGSTDEVSLISRSKVIVITV